MGILDEAIREHLELKRQHGAGEPELKQLEDEAFGPPLRPGEEESQPDAFAEAPTEFMTAPSSESAEDEAPPVEAEETPSSRRESIAEIQEAPESSTEAPEPVEEEHPAMEHEAVTEPSTEERQEIASHPTEMYDVEGEIAASQPVPSEEELLEEEMNEPRLAPVDPILPPEDGEEGHGDEEEDEDDFFDEKRLSEELDQALEAPVEEGDPVDSEEFEQVEPDDEGEIDEEEEVEEEEEDDDVLEHTPDFLEDSDDDQLWFEQKPPKDFDFDD